MFLAFLANKNIRPMKAQYLDTFYKMLVNFKNEDIHYVLTEEYLEEYKGVWANCLIDYKNINFNELNKTIIEVPNNFDKPLKNQVINYNVKFNEKLCKDLLEIYNTEDIHCIISWMNNATVRAFAEATNLPLIHNELGALRPNLWKDSIYLDFQGVNHNTEFEERLICFSKIVDKIELLSQEDLIKLVAKDKSTALNIYNNKTCDKVGVALQVSTDSNLLMYSNGWGIDDIISYAYNKYGKENLLIKNHPFSMLQFEHKDFAFVNTPEELLMRSKKIITINSSMAFEAMLLGKEVEIIGDNTFKLLTQLEGMSKLATLNFAVISYLVPANLLFNKDYYNFRINCNDEVTLFNEGLVNWKKAC